MEIELWDREEERSLTRLECVRFYINCHSRRVYKYDKRTYYCGNAFVDASDRYEVRMKEES